MRSDSKEKLFYFAIFFGCLIAFPISTPYLDLLLISVYLFLQISKTIWNASVFSFLKFNTLPPLALFSYFLLRDTFSLWNFFEFKTLRILLVHFVLLIFIVFQILQPNSRINYMFVLRISILYFAFYDIFYLFMRLTGQNWATLQTVYLTGSVYASIPFLFTSYLILENSSNRSLRSEYFLTILALISAVLYSSRTLLLFILLFLVIYYFKSQVEIKKKHKFVFGFLLMTIFLSLTSGVFVSHSNDLRVSNNSETTTISEDKIVQTDISIVSFLKDVSSSALFLVNNRKSDDDRKAHILCALESLENRTILNNLIGSGTNTYRHTLGSCTQFGGQGYSDDVIERKDKGSQSISFTVIMLDYGLFAFILLVLVFMSRLYDFYQRRVSFTYLLYFVLNFYLFFVTNLGAAFIVWLYFSSPKMYQRNL